MLAGKSWATFTRDKINWVISLYFILQLRVWLDCTALMGAAAANISSSWAFVDSRCAKLRDAAGRLGGRAHVSAAATLLLPFPRVPDGWAWGIGKTRKESWRTSCEKTFEKCLLHWKCHWYCLRSPTSSSSPPNRQPANSSQFWNQVLWRWRRIK